MIEEKGREVWVRKDNKSRFNCGGWVGGKQNEGKQEEEKEGGQREEERRHKEKCP